MQHDFGLVVLCEFNASALKQDTIDRSNFSIFCEQTEKQHKVLDYSNLYKTRKKIQHDVILTTATRHITVCKL